MSRLREEQPGPLGTSVRPVDDELHTQRAEHLDRFNGEELVAQPSMWQSIGGGQEVRLDLA